MKPTQKSFFLILALACSLGLTASTPAPYFSIRSQGTNAVREMVGWQELINLCGKDEHYGSFALIGEYSQSFRQEKICHCLFGDDARTNDNVCGADCGECAIKISGSCVDGRGKHDWVADYFGLPQDYEGVATFRPQIKNIIADLEIYWGAAQYAEGLYFRFNLPITYSKWDLRFEETVTKRPNTDVTAVSFPAGYFGGGAITQANLLTRASDFFSGLSTPTIAGVTFQPLECSKWKPFNCDCGGSSLHKTRPADLEMVAGWNFACCEDYHFGFNVRSCAPTGNKPNGEFLFEPIVGNGGHWELGGGLSMHTTAWRSCTSDASFAIYLDANVTHLFGTCQKRFFDLCGKPNSRYMLAEKMEPNTETLAGSTATSLYQFANEFAPVANLTCSAVKVSVAAEGDLALKFAYSDGEGMTYDLGYNFWGRSCEKIKRKTCGLGGDPLDGKTWGLKGDAFVYGIGEVSGTAIPLAATDSKATINQGSNFQARACDSIEAFSNAGIDNPEFAVTTFQGATQKIVNKFTQVEPVANPAPGEPSNVQTAVVTQINTSIQPVLLTVDDVDFVTTKGMSHTLFTHINYTWLDDRCCTPFLGVGASAEFGQSGNECCDQMCGESSNCSSSSSSSSCDIDNSGTCVSCALSQWSVWVKCGFAFN